MDTDFAYVAGLIDGEGCIHLDVGKGTYKPRVSVGMTEPALPMLTALREQWGGTLYQQRVATARWAAAWTWHMTGPPAVSLLVAIRPYLRLKARQADAALRVHAIWLDLERRPNGSAHWTPDARSACEAIKQEMHTLNTKGPRAPVSTVEDV